MQERRAPASRLSRINEGHPEMFFCQKRAMRALGGSTQLRDAGTAPTPLGTVSKGSLPLAAANICFEIFALVAR
jgi:hypothetical protein